MYIMEQRKKTEFITQMSPEHSYGFAIHYIGIEDCVFTSDKIRSASHGNIKSEWKNLEYFFLRNFKLEFIYG